MSLLVLQEPTVTQNWDVWSRSRGQTMLSKNHTLHVAYLHPFSQIDNQICSSHHKNPLFFSIHFTFGPFLAFIRLWIECIILRPCIGTNWPLICPILGIFLPTLIHSNCQVRSSLSPLLSTSPNPSSQSVTHQMRRSVVDKILTLIRMQLDISQRTRNRWYLPHS